MPSPDPLLDLPGHELVEVGTVAIDVDGETVVAALCEARPMTVTADA